MGDPRYTVMIMADGKAPVETHTNYRHAAVVRFSRALLAAGDRAITAVVVDHHRNDEVVASATFTPGVTPSNREDGNGKAEA